MLRPIRMVTRPFRRRPRLLGMAVLGIGAFALGRRAGEQSALSSDDAERTRRLAALADLHAADALTDEEYTAARRRILES